MKNKIILILSLLLVMTGCIQSSKNVFNQEQFDQLVEAVKVEYGEDYYPSFVYEDDYIENVLLINPEHLNAYYAEGPLFTMGVDLFILVHVKNEYFEQVYAAMQEYHRFLKEDSFQYPMNSYKVSASKLITKGNYIALVLLAPYMEIDEDTEESDIITFYDREVNRGVDVLLQLIP